MGKARYMRKGPRGPKVSKAGASPVQRPTVVGGVTYEAGPGELLKRRNKLMEQRRLLDRRDALMARRREQQRLLNRRDAIMLMRSKP